MPAITVPASGDILHGRKLGIGVLGCSDIALRRFLPAVARSRRARVVAIASRDQENAAKIARLYGCEVMGYQNLLHSDQVDLVYIPLPNSTLSHSKRA